MADPSSISPYLIESYVAPKQEAVSKIEGALARLVDAEESIRHVATTYIPDDDLALYVFTATSEELLLATVTAAGICADRVTPIVICLPTTPELGTT
jgi:hypothetical protein